MKYNTIEDFIKHSKYHINDIDYDDGIFNINIASLFSNQTMTIKSISLIECKKQLLKWANNQHKQSIIE